MARKHGEKPSAESSEQPLDAALLQTQMLTAQELAVYLRVNRSTVYRLLKKGELPGFRIGSEWRFRIDEVNRWFREHPSRRQ